MAVHENVITSNHCLHSALIQRKSVPPKIKCGMSVSCAGILHSILAHLLFMISPLIKPLALNAVRMRVASAIRGRSCAVSPLDRVVVFLSKQVARRREEEESACIRRRRRHFHLQTGR